MNLTIKNIVKNQINESSLSRIWQHIKNNTSFGVISAFMSGLSLEENLKRHNSLKSDIKGLKLGFIEQRSGYTYLKKDETEEQVEEMSFFVPNITYQQIINLGKKYNQETIIYKDNYRFDLIDCESGRVEMSFSKDNTHTFNPEVLKYAWSQFLKSKNKNALKSNAFYTLEQYIPSKADSLKNLKEGKVLAKVREIKLF